MAAPRITLLPALHRPLPLRLWRVFTPLGRATIGAVLVAALLCAAAITGGCP